jgi:hypothetical protein
VGSVAVVDVNVAPPLIVPTAVPAGEVVKFAVVHVFDPTGVTLATVAETRPRF